MSRYEAGRRFEWRVRAELEAIGYNVGRSAGSKTKVDLWAIAPGRILLVQCKRDGRLMPSERHELVRLSGHLPGVAFPVLARCGLRGEGTVFELLTGSGPRDRERFDPECVSFGLMLGYESIRQARADRVEEEDDTRSWCCPDARTAARRLCGCGGYPG